MSLFRKRWVVVPQVKHKNDDGWATFEEYYRYFWRYKDATAYLRDWSALAMAERGNNLQYRITLMRSSRKIVVPE